MISRHQKLHHGLAAVLAFLALTLLVFTGCGSDGDSTETKALTHAQVVKEADAICAKEGTEASSKLSSEIKRLESSQQPLDSSAEVKLVLAINIPAIEHIASGLDELDAPPEDAKELEAVATAFADAASEIKSNPQGNYQDPYGKASGLAGAFGLVECSKF